MRAASRGMALRVWMLVTAALLAVAGGQSGHEDHHRDHGFGPFGQHHPGGGRDEEVGGEHGEYSPFGQHSGGPPEREGEGRQEHGSLGQQDAGPLGGGVCTGDQTKDALASLSAYTECAGLQYGDLMSLVHADVEVLQEAVVCFRGKSEDIQRDIEPGSGKPADEEVKKVEDRLMNALQQCVTAAKVADDTGAAKATTDFLQKVLGPDSMVCSCIPAFVDKMPECSTWAEFHRFGVHLTELCFHASGAGSLFDGPGPAEVSKAEDVDQMSPYAGSPQQEEVVDVPGGDETRTATAAAEEEHLPQIPDVRGPCPIGQERQGGRTNGPEDCQPPVGSEEEFEAAGGGRGWDDGRSPPPKSGGFLGLGTSALGVLAVGCVVGVGGVWAWGKFRSGTRQPGVRYVATGVDDDHLGTELGPFGREYP